MERKEREKHGRRVALRKESVDRNLAGGQLVDLGQKSLSARRAWIEIVDVVPVQHGCQVALRKESVDRNNFCRLHHNVSVVSLSARRAWIEICYVDRVAIYHKVALRKESVDRNSRSFLSKIIRYQVALRKESVDRNYSIKISTAEPKPSLSARRAWIEIFFVMYH